MRHAASRIAAEMVRLATSLITRRDKPPGVNS